MTKDITSKEVIDWGLRVIHGLLLILCSVIAFQGHQVISQIQRQNDLINRHSVEIAELQKGEKNIDRRLDGMDNKLDRLIEQTK